MCATWLFFLTERSFLSRIFVVRRFLAVCFCVFGMWKPEMREMRLKTVGADNQVVKGRSLAGRC